MVMPKGCAALQPVTGLEGAAMTSLAPIRKIYFGIADRHQMFRLFDRHAGRPDRWQKDDSALYAGEWFEIAQAQHDTMLEILPPLWMRSEMFAMREFLIGSITSVFYTLRINQVTRFFHAYCDLSDPRSPYDMRDAIVERERQPVKAMTRKERIEHIWSATDKRTCTTEPGAEPSAGSATA